MARVGLASFSSVCFTESGRAGCSSTVLVQGRGWIRAWRWLRVGLMRRALRWWEAHQCGGASGECAAGALLWPWRADGHHSAEWGGDRCYAARFGHCSRPGSRRVPPTTHGGRTWSSRATSSSAGTQMATVAACKGGVATSAPAAVTLKTDGISSEPIIRTPKDEQGPDRCRAVLLRSAVLQLPSNVSTVRW